jgi:hypothetical protein
MKKLIGILMMSMLFMLTFTNCGSNTPSSDMIQQQQTEQILNEANNEIGMPSIINYQEKKNLKWIYELCDTENLVCYAYLWNEFNGKLVFIGKCIGYGIPYGTQYSNPEKAVRTDQAVITNTACDYTPIILPQAEPNGLFKPIGLSATWLIMIDPVTKEPRPCYFEPQIIVSPFKLEI